MNTNDPFEQRLRRQRLQPVPPAWRQAILAQARRAAHAGSAAGPGARPFWLLLMDLRYLLWPSPRAWAALAAAWAITLVLNLAAGGGDADPSLSRRTLPAFEFRQIRQQQWQMLAELGHAPDAPEAAPSPATNVPPHSQNRPALLNT